MFKSFLRLIKNLYKILYSKKLLMGFRKEHKLNELQSLNRLGDKYYIIRYDDAMNSGWTVWQRVVLYGCIYAYDHNMIPVVDMKNSKNIYQSVIDGELLNSWEEYFDQPADVSLETALESGNYVLGDPSQKWFEYVRLRKLKIFDQEYLRKIYTHVVTYRTDVEKILNNNYSVMIGDELKGEYADNLLGICVRGSDYKTFHHMKQPIVKDVCDKARKIIKEYNCKGVFVATEDKDILDSIRHELDGINIFSYRAGEISKTYDYIGNMIRKNKTAREASLDYLTVLYALSRCKCLIGGLCGATIVAQYNRSKSYEYIEIIDMKEKY